MTTSKSLSLRRRHPDRWRYLILLPSLPSQTIAIKRITDFYCRTGPDSENSEASFRLDGNTGEIWAAQLRSGDYSLKVAAKDGSGFDAAQEASVQIAVLAVDASKPYAVFVKSQYSFAVPEDAPVGTAVGTVTVSLNQSGTYYLLSRKPIIIIPSFYSRVNYVECTLFFFIDKIFKTFFIIITIYNCTNIWTPNELCVYIYTWWCCKTCLLYFIVIILIFLLPK